MHRVADTTLLMVRAGGAAGLLAAAYWPAMLAGLWWGVALSWPVGVGARSRQEHSAHGWHQPNA